MGATSRLARLGAAYCELVAAPSRLAKTLREVGGVEVFPLPCASDSRRAKACDRLFPGRCWQERRRYDRRPRVDAGIDALPGWQQAIRREVRQLATPPTRRSPDHQAHQPPLLRPGGLHSSTTGIVPGPEGIITGGPCQQDRRTVAIRYGEAVTAPALIAMFRQIIASDRVGGWCELKRQADRGDRVRLATW